MKRLGLLAFLLGTYQTRLGHADSGLAGEQFPNKGYFLKQAKFKDSNGVPRANAKHGAWRAKWDYETENRYCTELTNTTVYPKYSFCSAWDISFDESTVGNCSCQTASSDGEYCSSWYCQKEEEADSTVEFNWQRCNCTSPHKQVNGNPGLSCEGWTCEEGTASGSSYSELWGMDPADSESDWECIDHQWREDLTGMFCQSFQGDELHTTHHFTMSGCSCTSPSDKRDFCEEYECKTYKMHKCDMEWGGCGVLELVIPVVGFLGSFFFVCFVYALCFSGPKDTVLDRMGCFDFEWYEGLGCWFNLLHSSASCALCCHALVWALPVWAGGCGTVGLAGFLVLGYFWAGLRGLVGTLAVYLGAAGCFKFMTPRLKPRCRCRVNFHTFTGAAWHMEVKEGGYLEVADKAGLNWEPGASRTLEFWVRPGRARGPAATLFEKPGPPPPTPQPPPQRESAGGGAAPGAAGEERLVAAGGPGVGGQQAVNFWLDLDAQGYLTLHDTVNMAILDGEDSRVVSTIPLNRNKWSHVAVVYDGARGRARLYLDGRADAEGPWAPGPPNGEPLLVAHGDLEGWFTGCLAECRLWSEARDKNALQGNMNKQIRGAPEHLRLYLRLDEGPADAEAVADRAPPPALVQPFGPVGYAAYPAPEVEAAPVFPHVALAPGGPRGGGGGGEEEEGCWWKTAVPVPEGLALCKEFTVEAWVCPAPSPAFDAETQAVLDQGPRSFGLARRGRKVELRAGGRWCDTGLRLEPGEWAHVAVTVSDEFKVEAFKDGKKNLELQLTLEKTKPLKGFPFTIGYREEDDATHTKAPADLWRGGLREVRCWSVVRAAWHMERCCRAFFAPDLAPGAGEEATFDVPGCPAFLTLRREILAESDFGLVAAWLLQEDVYQEEEKNEEQHRVQYLGASALGAVSSSQEQPSAGVGDVTIDI